MRYLILAAGLGRRLGDASAGLPKCLIDINGEPLIGRLVRQIRSNDPAADIDVVVGYRGDDVAAAVDGCRITVNPFFDVTGINASLWFARAAFDRPVMLIHADLVLADELMTKLLAAEAETLMAFDSTRREPTEINVAVADGRVVRFDENFTGYSGLYACVLKLSQRAAGAFAASLDRRIRQGFNDPEDYYFFLVRALIADHGVTVAAFDFAGHDWQEIDRREDIVAARTRFGGIAVAEAP